MVTRFPPSGATSRTGPLLGLARAVAGRSGTRSRRLAPALPSAFIAVLLLALVACTATAPVAPSGRLTPQESLAIPVVPTSSSAIATLPPVVAELGRVLEDRTGLISEDQAIVTSIAHGSNAPGARRVAYLVVMTADGPGKGKPAWIIHYSDFERFEPGPSTPPGESPYAGDTVRSVLVAVDAVTGAYLWTVETSVGADGAASPAATHVTQSFSARRSTSVRDGSDRAAVRRDAERPARGTRGEPARP